jgi:hypothetical protein
MFVEFACKVLATAFTSVIVAQVVAYFVRKAYGKKYKELFEKYDD